MEYAHAEGIYQFPDDGKIVFCIGGVRLSSGEVVYPHSRTSYSSECPNGFGPLMAGTITFDKSDEYFDPIYELQYRFGAGIVWKDTDGKSLDEPYRRLQCLHDQY